MCQFQALYKWYAFGRDDAAIGQAKVGSSWGQHQKYQDFLGVDLEEQASLSEYWRSDISPYWDELFNIRDWIDFAGSADDLEAWLIPDLIAGDLPRPSLTVQLDPILSDRDS